MSHLPERKEKICLNCKSVIYGRYCHVCGQENTEPKETFWGLVTHFVYDLTHFDGKFFLTTRYLLFRPGFLAAEFLRGRRASYLNPIRMYIFTSAFFFIIFFAFIIRESPSQTIAEEKRELVQERQELEKELASETDSSRVRKLRKKIKQKNKQIALVGQTGVIKVGEADTASNWILFDNLPSSVAQYDSAQRGLPENRRDNWFWRRGVEKGIALNEKYRGRKKEFMRNFNDKFMHSIPQMMFVSLPLVALILQLLYFRHKRIFYVNHVIFTVNLYIAAFILLLLFYISASLYSSTGLRIFEILAFFTYVAIFYHVYKAMRNFYRQRRAKTIIKFFLFISGFFALMLLLMGIYLVTSALQI